ncbi:MAG: neuromedin U [Candidatus Korobacteraceae bacterium]|jgi:hypothetical protein
MKEKLFKAVLMLVVLMVLTGLAWSQDAQPNVTLIVNGQSVQIPVVQMNGKSYVDVDALARLTNGSVSLKGNQVISTPAGSAPSTPPARAKAVAQDTPIGPEGTSVATQATPEAAANADELRKAAQNPIASLISVPIQPTWNFGIGPRDRTQNIWLVQPVIPASMSTNWNLITRWITPVVYQPIPVPQPPGSPNQETGVFGLGDMNPSFFLSPKKSKVIWGVGPTLVLPTATNTTYLGQGKLSMGPSVVALVQPSHFTIGFLANNYWSVAGHSDLNKPAVNQFLLQYFMNYNMKKGYYLVTAPIITANWRQTDGGRWIVPFGGGAGRIMKLGFQPVNIQAMLYGNAIHPPGQSPWALKMQISFLFPKLSKEEEKMLLEQKLKQLDQEPTPPSKQ